MTRPGGKVLATEFCWREPPTDTAREVFLGQVCPGLQFDTLEDWVQLYQAAGLSDISTESGPFEMMTPRGFLSDEGAARSLAIMGRVVSRPATSIMKARRREERSRRWSASSRTPTTPGSTTR